MAHSCRWRFPARPGGSSNSGTGRRAGRVRVTASLRNVPGAHPSAAGLGPGFDAALQVSSVIGSNLQKFRDVLGERSDSSSGEVSTAPDRSNSVVTRATSRQLGGSADPGEPFLAFELRCNGSSRSKRGPSLLCSVQCGWSKLVIGRMLTNFELAVWPEAAGETRSDLYHKLYHRNSEYSSEQSFLHLGGLTGSISSDGLELTG